MFKLVLLFLCSAIAVVGGDLAFQSEVLWDRYESEIPANVNCLPGLSLCYNKQIKKVNSFLTEKVRSSLPGSNFEIARKATGIEKDKDLVAGLHRFLELERLDEESFKCTDAAYNILRDIDTATQGKRMRRKKLTRVEKVFFQVAADHSKYCIKQMQLNQKEHLYNVNILEHGDNRKAIIFAHEIDFGLEEVKLTYYCDSAEILEIVKVPGSIALNSLFDAYRGVASKALTVLRVLSAGDPNGQFAGVYLDEDTHERKVDAEKLAELFMTHIAGPCERFVIYSKRVYKNTLIDLRLISFWYLIAMDFKTVGVDWVVYHICDLLVNHDNGRLLDRMIKLEQSLLLPAKHLS